jgi:hypothetical protein
MSGPLRAPRARRRDSRNGCDREYAPPSGVGGRLRAGRGEPANLRWGARGYTDRANDMPPVTGGKSTNCGSGAWPQQLTLADDRPNSAERCDRYHCGLRTTLRCCGMAFLSTPLCPRCDREMRYVPSVGQRAVFLCVGCGHVETREQSDPSAGVTQRRPPVRFTRRTLSTSPIGVCVTH